VSTSIDEWVTFEPLAPGSRLPLLARPAVEGVSLVEWVRECRPRIEALLGVHGGLLFRGFSSQGGDDLRRLAQSFGGDAVDYRERSSPRREVTRNVYTSTEHPADQEILPHNENSYAASWPRKIFFFCQQPAEQGGATPLADSRRVLGRIPRAIVERFERSGVAYVRNFGDGIGLTWKQSFQTEEAREVENYCRRNQIEWEWKPGGRLRTLAVRPATVTHWATGEPVWFNQVLLFHPASLPAEARRVLTSEFAPEDLPLMVRYGDGATIEDEVVDMLRAAYREEAVSFPWEKGDVLALDNVLVAHGRAPFTGPRKILVAMAEEGAWPRA
jgi:alpha-ketoglutarate-dependent taurine dioxygenase